MEFKAGDKVVINYSKGKLEFVGQIIGFTKPVGEEGWYTIRLQNGKKADSYTKYLSHLQKTNLNDILF